MTFTIFKENLGCAWVKAKDKLFLDYDVIAECVYLVIGTSN